MPPIITPGYSFTVNEKVTPDKLNKLVDLATYTGVSVSEVVSSGGRCLDYGSVAPTLERGHIWFDTTPGFEGLKSAFLTASNASFARWLYRTPHWDGVFWAESGATYGIPQFLGGFDNWKNGYYNFQLFDGHAFPRIVPANPAAGEVLPFNNLVCVVPLESRSDPGPVVAAIGGLVPGVFDKSTITLGSFVCVPNVSPGLFTTFQNTGPAVRSLLLGIVMSTAASPSSNPSWLKWVTPAVEDNVT